MILDVVYNHTAEGGADGPTLSLARPGQRGLLPARDDGRRYVDYTGCGNTLDLRHPRTLAMVTDSLRYWVAGDARRRLPVRPRPGAGPRRSTRSTPTGTFLIVIGAGPGALARSS